MFCVPRSFDFTLHVIYHSRTEFMCSLHVKVTEIVDEMECSVKAKWPENVQRNKNLEAVFNRIHLRVFLVFDKLGLKKSTYRLVVYSVIVQIHEVNSVCSDSGFKVNREIPQMLLELICATNIHEASTYEEKAFLLIRQ